MSGHLFNASDDFRAGMAHAAHLLRHAVGSAHGGDAGERGALEQMEPRFCCQRAVLGMAEGMAQGFDDIAGGVRADDHEHQS